MHQNSKEKKGKVLVAMSGGVDSSMAAAMLQKEGYDCQGAHMALWKDQEDHEKVKKSVEFVEEVCKKLGIPFHLVNLKEPFKKNVVDDFIKKYGSGETPNPCVLCNRTIKFGALFEKMEELGCDYLATGHYVRLTHDPDGTVHIHQGTDSKKDQSYFLYVIPQEKLKKVMFPLGEYEKPQVRKMAMEFGFPELAEKAESQDVCFYQEKSNLPFLQRHLKRGLDFKEGEIKNTQGEVIGKHKGLPFYTRGQRRGLDIGGGPALYVQKIDTIKNTLIVGSADELRTDEIEIKETNFASGKFPSEDETYDARVRHQGRLTKAKIKREGDRTVVRFVEPQGAVMAGQSLVLYKNGELIGGGVMSFL